MGCNKWQNQFTYESNQFRNEFVGKWYIDSIHWLESVDTSYVWLDSVYTGKNRYYVAISETQTLFDDNVLCETNIFNEISKFNMEAAAYSNRADNVLYFLIIGNQANTVDLKESYKYISGTQQIVEHNKGKKLVLVNKSTTFEGYKYSYTYLSRN